MSAKANASRTPCRARISCSWPITVLVCGERLDYAYDDLFYLERACQAQVLAQSTGRPLAPVNPELAGKVAAQVQSERLQSALFFERCGGN